MAKTLVYLLLGIPGSGRRFILADLIENGLDREETNQVFFPPDEPANPDDALLEKLENTTLRPGPGLDALEDPSNQTTNLFVILPGNQNPVDQIESWKNALYKKQENFEMARILTVVHAEFLSQNPKARAWFDACIHFSDVVLLHRREGAGNKWVNDFMKEYEKKHLPCLFEVVKKNGVTNPQRILDPEPRRLSQVFEFWDADQAMLEDLEVEIEGDPLEEDEVDEEDSIPEDPYFARMPGGRRLKKIPDIREFLESEA